MANELKSIADKYNVQVGCALFELGFTSPDGSPLKPGTPFNESDLENGYRAGGGQFLDMLEASGVPAEVVDYLEDTFAGISPSLVPGTADVVSMEPKKPCGCKGNEKSTLAEYGLPISIPDRQLGWWVAGILLAFLIFRPSA